MLEELRNLNAALKKLRADVTKEKGPRIAKAPLRNNTEALATEWFATISVSLAQHPAVPAPMVERYTALFKVLLKLPKSNNLRTSYLKALNSLLRNFHDELIFPIQTEPKLAKISALEEMLAGLPQEEENAYLKEAIDCARAGFLRAAAVLGVVRWH